MSEKKGGRVRVREGGKVRVRRRERVGGGKGGKEG